MEYHKRVGVAPQKVEILVDASGLKLVGLPGLEPGTKAL